MTGTYVPTDLTRVRRKAHRATYDAATVHAIIDAAPILSVAAIVDGHVRVQPMLHHRMGETVILHGLARNGLLSAIAGGAEACLNATILDALALARTIEDHSMLYRSATLYGHGTELTDLDRKHEVMLAVFETLVGAGRLQALPPLDRAYLAGTMVVEVAIEQAVAKVNAAVETGQGAGELWSGLIPLAITPGPPQPDDRTRADPGVPLLHLPTARYGAQA